MDVLSEVRMGLSMSDFRVRKSGLLIQVGSPRSEARVGTFGSTVRLGGFLRSFDIEGV